MSFGRLPYEASTLMASFSMYILCPKGQAVSVKLRQHQNRQEQLQIGGHLGTCRGDGDAAELFRSHISAVHPEARIISLLLPLQNKTLPIEDTTDCLSTMACVCRVMLETP